MPELAFERASAGQPLKAGPEGRRALGRLAIAAVPGFYSLIPLGADKLEEVIGEQIGTAGTELQEASFAMADEAPAALVTWLPVEALDGARRAGSIGMMRHLERAATPAFLKALGEYSKVVEPIGGDGLYLSRVAVAPGFRGQGLGRRAVEQVIDAADGGDVSLHVAADNGPAIALYQSMGFEFSGGGGDYQSRAMRRPGRAD